MVGENIPFAGPGFSFYHGQFKEGVREGERMGRRYTENMASRVYVHVKQSRQ